MMIQYKMDKAFEKICLLLLFLFAISFMNWAGYIICAVFFVFLFVVARYPLLLDRNFFILLFFSIFYYTNFTLNWGFGVKETIWYLLAPWWCYLCGKWYVVYASGGDPLRKLTLILAGGFFLHGVLNVFAYVQTYGIVYVLSTTYRITVDFWRGDVISVTASSLYYVPLMTFAIGCLFLGSTKRGKAASWLVILLGALANVLYANRTAFVIIALLFVVGVIMILFRKNNVKAWVGVSMLTVVLAAVWTSDLGGLRSWVSGLRVVERFTGNDMGRVSLWIDFLGSDWWRYPFGGNRIGQRYVHNLWLDILRTVGILPFLLLIVFTVCSLFDIKRFFKNCGRRDWVYGFMLAGILLSCAVEPVMSANPYYVMLWVMLMGGINGMSLRPATLEER